MSKKTKQKAVHFYTKASHLLSRGAPKDSLYDLLEEYDITKEQVDIYLKRQVTSKAVSSAIVAGREEKELLFQMLDQKFIAQHTNIVIFRRGENVEFYQYKEGVYEIILLQDMVNLVDAFMAQYSLFDYRTSQRVIKDTVSRIGALLSRTPQRFFSADSLRFQKWYLNLKNGLLDLKDFTLSPHTPDYFSTVQVPFAYDPEALHPLFDDFLKIVSDNNKSTEQMIQEMFGYCVMEGNPKHKVFYLYGDTARNGKSTTAKIICGLIGWGNVSTLSLAQIGGENSTILTSLVGKQINFSDEISSKFIESSRLTTLSAEGVVEINPKYKNSYLYLVKAKFIITCNDLPRFQDAQGMKHRMVSIPFRHQFKEEERISRYDEILLEKEGAGILNWAIEGAKRLKESNVFTTNEESREDMHDNLMQNNSIYAFLEMNYEFGDFDGKIHPKDIYGSEETISTKGSGFRLFCKEKGIFPVSFFTFCRELKRFSRETGKTKQMRDENSVRYYTGLRSNIDSF